jgi:hypothetical protein
VDIYIDVNNTGKYEYGDPVLSIRIMDALQIIRDYMIVNANNNIMYYAGNRNPRYWTDDNDPNREYHIINDVPPHVAIADMWNTYKTDEGTDDEITWYPGAGCKRMCELIYLKSIADLCLDIDNANGDHAMINLFDNAVGHGSISDMFDEPNDNTQILWYERIDNNGFIESDMTPGDRIHLDNPLYHGQGNGEEGSNEIYIGNDTYVGLTGRQFPSLDELKQYVAGIANNSPGGKPLIDWRNIKVVTIYQPLVPKFIK